MGRYRLLILEFVGFLASFLEQFDLLIDYGRGSVCLDATKQMKGKIKGERIALAPTTPGEQPPLY